MHRKCYARIAMNRYERLVNGPIKELLKDADALVITEANSIALTTDVVPSTLAVVPDRLWIPVFHCEADPFWVVADITEGAVRRQSQYIRDFVIYREFVKTPIKALAEALLERGLPHKRIYIQMDNLVADYYLELKRLLPDVEILDAGEAIWQMKQIKSEDEQEIMTRITNLTLEALKYTYENTHEGETELEIQGRAVSALFDKGAETLEFITLARGRTDALNMKASNARLQKGDMLRIDMGGHFGSFRSDIHRTAVCGKPSPGQIDGWKRNREVHYKTIETMQPGALVSNTFNFCIAEYERNGLKCTMPHIGHSIGCGQHEHPIISPFFNVEYKPGMMFMLEPMGIDAATGGYSIEDLILITENGPKLMSTAVGTEEMFVIE